MAPLEVAGSRREHGRLAALARLDLTVAAGECVALVGANGGGKSTAVRRDRRPARDERRQRRRVRPRPAPGAGAENARAALALDTPLLYADLTVRQHL